MIDRDEDGRLPLVAWPGCYPLVYTTADGGELCPECARGNASEDLDPECPDNDQWRLIGQDVHWEGPPIQCDHCHGGIHSAYGDPDAEGNDA